MATEYKGNAILEIIKGEFKEQNLSRLKIMSHLIAAISLTQTICLWRLCEVIPLKTKIISINRRLQRFISEVVLDSEIIALFLFKICGVKNDVYLILDRTNWKLGQTNINILMLALSWNGKSIPIFWKLMNKRGNSNAEERLELLKKFKKVFPSVKIAGLLADREFIGEKWFLELIQMEIPFFIRVRNNFLILRNGRIQSIKKLFRKLPINGAKVFHRTRKVLDVPLFISGTKYRNKNNKIDYCIVVSNIDHEVPLEEYRMRWQIESVFKNMKSSGFDFESTHVTKHERLSNLIALVSIAYVWVVKIGEKILKTMTTNEILKHGRRKISIFRLGLRHLRNAITSRQSKAFQEYLELLSYT